MITFYRHKNPEQTFDPESHAYLVRYTSKYRGPLCLYPMKDTDRPTPFSGLWEKFEPVSANEVPLEVRQMAYARLGGFIRHLK